MQDLRVAVIGIGYLGSIHARLYRELPGCKLIGVCDTDPVKLAAATSELQIPGFHDHRELLGKVDAVSVAVPTKAHYQVASDFLKKGIHTLVEKPFTVDLKEADTLIRLARRSKSILQVGHVERFNSAFAAVQKLITVPRFIECHRLSQFPRRSLDIGVILDLMIHDIDIILGLVKSPLKKFEAVGVPVLTPYEDIANARLTFANGCVCNLTASRISDDPTRKIRIFQNDAYISLDYKNEQAHVYRKSAAGITKDALPIEREQPLKKELASFLESAATGNPPLVDGPTGRAALEVALKIRNAVWKR